MGCDIHCYLEVERSGSWDTLCKRPYVERNYELFERMAGVRGLDANAIVPPRGIPRDIARRGTADDYTMFVHDTPTDSEGFCTPQKAAEWIAAGRSEWWDEERRRITHPDWHTPGWLTAAEVAQVAAQCGGFMMRTFAMIMIALERAGTKTRLVFWFDN